MRNASNIAKTVDLGAPPQRVFRALASKDVCDWWVRPGIFDTREWTGDVRPGGRWRTTGIGWETSFARLVEIL